MVHPFDLRDSLALQRLIGRGVSFDSRTYLTQDLHLFRNAVLAPLLPRFIPETLVVDSVGRASGFAQLSHRLGHAASRLRFLSPRDNLSGVMGTELIESLLITAGRRRAQHILADAEEKTEECGFLRREGFSVYARQDIWKGVPPFPQDVRKPPGEFRPLLAGDSPSLLALYCSIVPALVNQVEGLPRRPRGWMIFEEGELVGFFHIHAGARGLWMEPFFHPGAQSATDWLALWLGGIGARAGEPVYVCVRSYQDWLGPILQDFGLSLMSRRAVLVRRVVVPVPVADEVALAAIDKTVPQATTYIPSVSQTNYDSATANHR
jgi:hypothetical protein